MELQILTYVNHAVATFVYNKYIIYLLYEVIFILVLTFNYITKRKVFVIFYIFISSIFCIFYTFAKYILFLICSISLSTCLSTCIVYWRIRRWTFKFARSRRDCVLIDLSVTLRLGFGFYVFFFMCVFYTFEHYKSHFVRLVFKGNVTDKSINTHTSCAKLNVHRCICFLCVFMRFEQEQPSQSDASCISVSWSKLAPHPCWASRASRKTSRCHQTD
jgi:hypothetical protein